MKGFNFHQVNDCCVRDYTFYKDLIKTIIENFIYLKYSEY